MSKILLTSLCACVLTGCVSIGNEKLLDEATVVQIKVGETTKEQVQALLGEPTKRVTARLSGFTYEWWHYSHAASTINPLEYLFLVGIFFNGFGMPDTRRELAVFFDPDGIVTNLAQQTTSYDMGTPFTPMRVMSSSITTLSLASRAGEPVRFEDKMETWY
jgi:outer membrane protein assembly factor BamE (lipoprotein component of BamABCDE complex)